MKTSVVLRTRKKSTSLRTTIPESIADLLKIQHGDSLAWDFHIENDKVIVTVKKAK